VGIWRTLLANVLPHVPNPKLTVHGRMTISDLEISIVRQFQEGWQFQASSHAPFSSLNDAVAFKITCDGGLIGSAGGKEGAIEQVGL